MSMNVFFENILDIFSKKEETESLSLEERMTLHEVSMLVRPMNEPYKAESNQIHSAFERLAVYLPSGIKPEELRILCNLCYIVKLMNIDNTKCWVGPPEQQTRKPKTPTLPYDPRIKGAFGKGFRDWVTQGADIVGPGENEFFLHK